MQSAARVGGLVILASVLGVGVLASLQAGMFARSTTPYKVVFEDAGGLTAGSRVMMSGVLIGRVELVALEKPGRAVALISVYDDVSLPGGSTAELPESFISIGDKEVRITPGSGEPLATNAEIPGSVTSPIESFFPDAKQTIASLDRTMAAVTKLLEDKDLKNSVLSLAQSGEKLMAEGAQTASSAGRLIRRMDGVVAQNASALPELMASTKRTLANVESLTAELDGIMSKGEFQKEAMDLLKGLNEAVLEGRNLVAEMNKVVADPELQAGLKTNLANVSKMTESGTRIAKNVEEISATGIEASKSANELLKKANGLAEDVQKLIERFKETLGGAGRAKDALSTVTLEADLVASGERGTLRTDVSASVPLGRETLELGMFDAFESNKINAQLRRSLAEGLDVRYGVYASKLGVGVQYRLAPSLGLRGDLYGLNDPTLDLRLRYDFSRSIHGWLGLNSAFNRNTPMIGFGIRR